MSTGKVKFFNDQKGFGFIKSDSDEKELFVHVSAIASGTLNEGDQVQFEIGEGKKGPCAVRVSRK